MTRLRTLLALVLVAGILPAQQPARRSAADSALIARADLGRIQGSPQAKVWVVMVSDFECPFCERWHKESYEALRREYVETGKVRFAYLNLPLSTHPNAVPAAEAAMCAGAQGKFWAAQDLIFREQARWRTAPDAPKALEALAVRAGAEATQLRACMASGVLRPLIEADADRAGRAGAMSTPSFLIGNRLVMGAQPTDVFRRAIDAALQASAAGGR